MKLQTALLVAAISAGSLGAQSTPFLTDRQIQLLSNEISGDRSYEHIRVLTRWHRDSGMEGYFKAAEYIKASKTKKPVVGFIAGITAPPGKRMGHAGAIISGGKGTAQEKLAVMEACGIKVTKNPAEMGKLLKSVL